MPNRFNIIEQAKAAAQLLTGAKPKVENNLGYRGQAGVRTALQNEALGREQPNPNLLNLAKSLPQSVRVESVTPKTYEPERPSLFQRFDIRPGNVAQAAAGFIPETVISRDLNRPKTQYIQGGDSPETKAKLPIYNEQAVKSQPQTEIKDLQQANILNDFPELKPKPERSPLNKNIDPTLWDAVSQASVKYDIPRNLLLGIAFKETGIRNVKQEDGYGRGYFQIDKSQHPEVSDEQAFDPYFAANWVADSLSRRLHSYHPATGEPFTVKQAIAAYNVGPNTEADIISPYYGVPIKSVAKKYSDDVINYATGIAWPD